MDINELALTIQQSRSARQAVYAQYRHASDDFFPLHYHGTLEESVLIAYLKCAQKHRKLMTLLPEILRFSGTGTISARVIRKIQALPANVRRNCVFALAHCELTVFQSCVLFSISPEMELFCFILDEMLRRDAYSLADVQLLVGFAKGISKRVIRDAAAQMDGSAEDSEKLRWLKVYAADERTSRRADDGDAIFRRE